jgi:hypothetical protein
MQKPPKMKVNLKSIRKDKQSTSNNENLNLEILGHNTELMDSIISEGQSDNSGSKTKV